MSQYLVNIDVRFCYPDVLNAGNISLQDPRDSYLTMEDPREIAWQRRCDYHSHMNAVRVAFAATYAQAIPNARRAQYYKARLPLMNQWVARRSKHERAMNPARGEGGGIFEERVAQDQVLRGMALKSVVVDYKRAKKRKARCEDMGPAAPRKGKEILRASGLDIEMGDSGVSTVEDEESNADIVSSDFVEETPLAGSAADNALAGPSSAELPPSTTAFRDAKENSKPPPQTSPANKKTRVSSRAHTASVTSSTASSSTGPLKPPKFSKGSAKAHYKKTRSKDNGEKKSGEASYEILPYWPGTTEVIFDRYPGLHKLAWAKRGKKRMANGANRDIRKMPDMNRLIFLCRKASSATNQNKTMKAGAENSVVSGSRQLIFLRRNVARP